MGQEVDKQDKFSGLVALLLLHIRSLGYKVTLGDAWAKTGHKTNSKHYIRLAVDLNVFTEDGTYLEDTEDHRVFGEYWEKIGGKWGGHFDDGNHYEL